MAQWYCAINGQQFGPVDDQTLTRWARERRLKATDLVWRDGMAEWTAAGNMPQLAGQFAQAAPAAPAYQAPGYQAPPSAAYSQAGRRRHYQPHRGGAVLTLGILGLCVCVICGIIAWAMGAEDMKKINAGLMDPEGRGMTHAGLICGMISCILTIVVVVIWVVVLAAVA